jgi:hypothetical protein
MTQPNNWSYGPWGWRFCRNLSQEVRDALTTVARHDVDYFATHRIANWRLRPYTTAEAQYQLEINRAGGHVVQPSFFTHVLTIRKPNRPLQVVAVPIQGDLDPRSTPLLREMVAAPSNAVLDGLLECWSYGLAVALVSVASKIVIL